MQEKLRVWKKRAPRRAAAHSNTMAIPVAQPVPTTSVMPLAAPVVRAPTAAAKAVTPAALPISVPAPSATKAAAMGARISGTQETATSPPRRKFGDIEEEENDDGEEAIRVMEEKMVRLGREEGSEMDVDEDRPRQSRKVKGKGKAREDWQSDDESDARQRPRASQSSKGAAAKKRVRIADEGSEMDVDEDGPRQLRKVKGKGKAREEKSDLDSDDESDGRQSSRPSQSSKGAAAKKRTRIANPTGDLWPKPCQTCTSYQIPCEKNVNGGACVPCKLKKKRCEYAFASMKKAKSRPTVESEDDRSPPPQNETVEVPETPPAKAPIGRGSRPKSAKKQPSRAAATKAAMAVEVERPDDSDILFQEVHRRTRSAAALQHSEWNTFGDFVIDTKF